MNKEILINYEVLESFLCEDEMKYFLEWDKEWLLTCGGFGTIKDDLYCYYKTNSGHVTFYINKYEYISKLISLGRNNKLESIGI